MHRDTAGQSRESSLVRTETLVSPEKAAPLHLKTDTAGQSQESSPLASRTLLVSLEKAIP